MAQNQQSALEAKSDRLAIQKQKWSNAMLVAVAPCALGLAVWAHGLLWSHEGRLITLEQQRAADLQRTEDVRAAFKEQMGEIKALLQRMDDKLETLRRNP